MKPMKDAPAHYEGIFSSVPRVTQAFVTVCNHRGAFYCIFGLTSKIPNCPELSPHWSESDWWHASHSACQCHRLSSVCFDPPQSPEHSAQPLHEKDVRASLLNSSLVPYLTSAKTDGTRGA